MTPLDPNLLRDIEAWSVRNDECVMLTRVQPTRIAKNCSTKTPTNAPELLPWACAIGEGVRYSFGFSPGEAWAKALARHQDKT